MPVGDSCTHLPAGAGGGGTAAAPHCASARCAQMLLLDTHSGQA